MTASVRSDRPWFSVLLATFNQAHYIEATLASVEAQTFHDYEVVVVNDGSTDDTEPRVLAWAERQRRGPRRTHVVYERIENSGQSAAFEHGFSRCTGRYVCLLDSDDLWLPEKLARVHDAAEADPEAGMIAHPLWVIDAQGRRTGDVRPKGATLTSGDARAHMRATGRHAAPATSGVTIRSDVFRQLLPMPTKQFRFAADAYLTFGATVLAPVRTVGEPLAEYRMHPGGQYIRRMLTPEGIDAQMALQRAIAQHFGLEAVVVRNSFFGRNAFAHAKFTAGPGRILQAYGRLVRATLADPFFSHTQRLQLSAFWTACLLAPRSGFARLWRWFQLKQTGYDRLTDTAPPG